MVPEKVKDWKNRDRKMIMEPVKVKNRKNRDHKMIFDPICESKTFYGSIKNILTRLNLSKLLLD